MYQDFLIQVFWPVDHYQLVQQITLTNWDVRFVTLDSISTVYFPLITAKALRCLHPSHLECCVGKDASSNTVMNDEHVCSSLIICHYVCVRIYIYTPTYIWLCISNLYLHIHHWYLHNHVFIHVYMIPWQRLCLGNAINPRTVWTDVSQREHRSGFVQSHWCFQGGNSNGSYHSSLLDLSFCFLCILTNAFVSDSQSILVEAFDY